MRFSATCAEPWGPFRRLITAEFQVTSIDVGPNSALDPPPARLRTGVRYELVGPARDFYRQQRVGQWELEWESSPAGEFRLHSWRLVR